MDVVFEEVDEIVLQDPELPFIAGRLAAPVQPNLIRMRELLAASKCNVMLVDGIDQVSASFLLQQRCCQGVVHPLAFRALLFLQTPAWKCSLLQAELLRARLLGTDLLLSPCCSFFWFACSSRLLVQPCTTGFNHVSRAECPRWATSISLQQLCLWD